MCRTKPPLLIRTQTLGVDFNVFRIQNGIKQYNLCVCVLDVLGVPVPKWSGHVYISEHFENLFYQIQSTKTNFNGNFSMQITNSLKCDTLIMWSCRWKSILRKKALSLFIVKNLSNYNYIFGVWAAVFVCVSWYFLSYYINLIVFNCLFQWDLT